MQDATEKSQYSELVEEPLRLELNLTYPLEHVIEPIVIGERMSPLAVDKFGDSGKNLWNKWNVSPANNQLYLTTQVLVPRFSYL